MSMSDCWAKRDDLRSKKVGDMYTVSYDGCPLQYTCAKNVAQTMLSI